MRQIGPRPRPRRGASRPRPRSRRPRPARAPRACAPRPRPTARASPPRARRTRSRSARSVGRRGERRGRGHPPARRRGSRARQGQARRDAARRSSRCSTCTPTSSRQRGRQQSRVRRPDHDAGREPARPAHAPVAPERPRGSQRRATRSEPAISEARGSTAQSAHNLRAHSPELETNGRKIAPSKPTPTGSAHARRPACCRGAHTNPPLTHARLAVARRSEPVDPALVSVLITIVPRAIHIVSRRTTSGPCAHPSTTHTAPMVLGPARPHPWPARGLHLAERRLPRSYAPRVFLSGGCRTSRARPARLVEPPPALQEDGLSPVMRGSVSGPRARRARGRAPRARRSAALHPDLHAAAAQALRSRRMHIREPFARQMNNLHVPRRRPAHADRRRRWWSAADGLARRGATPICAAAASRFGHGHIGGAIDLGRRGGASSSSCPGSPSCSRRPHDLPAHVPHWGSQAAAQIGVAPAALRPLADGQCMAVGGFGLEFLHTPGHSPGSMSPVSRGCAAARTRPRAPRTRPATPRTRPTTTGPRTCSSSRATPSSPARAGASTCRGRTRA